MILIWVKRGRLLEAGHVFYRLLTEKQREGKGRWQMPVSIYECRKEDAKIKVVGSP